MGPGDWVTKALADGARPAVALSLAAAQDAETRSAEAKCDSYLDVTLDDMRTRTYILIPILGLLAVLLVPASALAGATDELTEEATSAEFAQPATSYGPKILRGCNLQMADPTLTVQCARNGYASFEYEFEVPAGAINLRPYVAEVGEENRDAYFGVEGYRRGSHGFRVLVGASGQGSWEFASVRITYDVPTAYDERSCVTSGEWARMNPVLGGSSGRLQKYAAVFETNGRQRRLSNWYGDFRFQIRSYNRCGSRQTYSITFHEYRSKTGWWAYWG